MFGDAGRLGAFLFFDRDVTERSNLTFVIRTLANQLGASDPGIRAAIRAVLGRNQNILMSYFHLQFKRLILDTLLTVELLPPAFVIVLDALDECGTADECKALLAVLAKDLATLPVSIRTVITSHAEIDIHNAFEGQPNILPLELDITSQANSDDILLYFRYRMELICTQGGYLRLGIGWPGEENFRQLVQRASGLFVWASTASDFINGHDPPKCLDVILNGGSACGAEAALDVLYKTALSSAGHWDDTDFVSDFRDIVGIILIARRPLSCTAIDKLLHMPEHRPSIYTISIVGCVLRQSSAVHVLHPSFADFLMDQKRCSRDIWSFDPSMYHQNLAYRCLDRMDVVLHHNICNLTLTADLATESLPKDISYSCMFWVDHLCIIEDDILPIIDLLCVFLRQHLLHWFEAMSILRRS